MTFTLNKQELDLIGKGLVLLPYYEVAPLLLNLQTQYEQQKETNEDKS